MECLVHLIQVDCEVCLLFLHLPEVVENVRISYEDLVAHIQLGERDKQGVEDIRSLESRHSVLR